jgi:hypothetical protein
MDTPIPMFSGGIYLKIIALEKETPGATASQFQIHLRAEARQAWKLYQSGLIREIYFRTDTNCAVLVLECASAGDAAQVLASLPLVREGLITFELIPLAPYDGFARLFTNGE